MLWSAVGYACHVAFVWLELCLSLGVSRFQLFFSSRPFFWISCVADIDLLQAVVNGLVCIWVCLICCICVACVVLVLGLVAVPTFFSLRPFFRISCLADTILLQVVVSGLVCIWACVTCCICVCLVLRLFLGWTRLQLFFSSRLFWGNSCLADINLLQVVVSGLVCIWVCGTCCAAVAYILLVFKAHRGCNFFLAFLLVDIMFRCYKFVAGRDERFRFHLCLVMLIAPPNAPPQVMNDTTIGNHF